MVINQLVLIGDSLTTGIVGSFGYGTIGSKGNWAQLVTDRLGNIPGLGPLVSSGIHQVSAFAQGDWAYTSGGNAWTGTLGTDAWDKSPYGVFGLGGPSLYYANGSGKIATWTAGYDIRYPNVGFTLYWVDYASGSSSTPSYSVDGGANYINFPDTPLRNNSIRKFYVATPVTRGSTVKIKAANTSNTGVGVAPLGIEVFYQPPSTASGLIVHNWALSGSLLANLVAATSGDCLALFDSAVLGTGAITNTPNLGTIIMHINDVGFASDTTWGADLTTFNTRVSPLGPVGIMSPWECNISAYNQTQQTAYRAKTKTIAAGFSPVAKVFDIYDEWSAMGVTGYSQSLAAGFLSDGTHESQAGHIDLANRIYLWIRKNFLTAFPAPASNYTVNGKRSIPAYGGKLAVPAHLAGSQIAPIPV